MRTSHWFLCSFAALGAACTTPGTPRLDQPRLLQQDAGWCWFQDERALVLDDRFVVFGSVANGRTDPLRRGDVQATRWDLRTGALDTFELADRLDRDDHAAPAFFRRGDGRLLVAYCTHGHDDLVRWRLGDATGSTLQFDPERTFRVPMRSGHGVTYSNLWMTAQGGGPCIPEAIVDICRAIDWDPTVVASFDDGETWQVTQRVVSGPGRPYAKYKGDGRIVHFVCTEQHPRDFDTGLWYGRLVATCPTLRGDDESPSMELDGDQWIGPAPEQLTPVFTGRPDAVAWPCDLELDADGRPCCVFSIQVDGAGRPQGEGGADLRYGYARFDGTRWHSREIAHAGTRLYRGEDDYTGLCCLVPGDPSIVFISTNADPVTGRPLISATDGRRHWEIYIGRTADPEAGFTWTPVTGNSTADNLRPLVPQGRVERSVLLWLSGTYRSYTDYDLDVLGMVLDLSVPGVAPRPHAALPQALVSSLGGASSSSSPL